MKRWFAALLLVAGIASSVPSGAVEPIRYRFSFPEPAGHWMQVEGRFPGLDSKPLELRISRSSPGRYSLHDFAKNVYDVQAYTPEGRELRTEKSDDSGWRVAAHPVWSR